MTTERKELHPVRFVHSQAARRRDGEDGFTLIELMVVVLIIAILIAIAIPTFLGARQRAQDRAAQSSLRNGLSAAKTLFTDRESYLDATTTALQAVEPSVSFLAAGSTNQNEVSVASPDANTFVASVQSRSGTCFFIQDSTVTGTRYARAAVASCAPASAPGTWVSSW